MTIFPVSSTNDQSEAASGLGSKDGRGGADHDQPYTFGRRPRADAPFPFRAQEYGRLLALRGCIADGLRASDDVDAAGLELLSPARRVDADPNRPSLCYTCDSCGVMVPGAHQSAEVVSCARCAHEDVPDRVARTILSIAGVLDLREAFEGQDGALDD